MIIDVQSFGKKLIVSFVNKVGKIEFLNINIPDEQYYKWEYSSANKADPKYISWDNRPVRKVPAKNFNKFRLQELFHDLGESITSPLFENNKPLTYYVDIEVEVNEDGFPDSDTAPNQINTIAICRYPDVYVLGNKPLSNEQINQIHANINNHISSLNTEYNFIYRYHKNESDLIMDFLENFVKESPAITGWNFWGYDWKYILKRCEYLCIDPSFISPTKTMYDFNYTDVVSSGVTVRSSIKLPKHKLIYDYFLVYKKWDLIVEFKESNSLDFVSEAALGIKKVPYTGGFKTLYENDYDKYVFYNAIDSILTEQLDFKLKTFNIYMSIANIVHTECRNVFSPINSIESILAQYAYKENKVFPVKEKATMAEREEYEGAFVFDPKPGIYELVCSWDFASLYPTIMRQFLISIENYKTKDKDYVPGPNEIKCVNGSVFEKGEWLIPNILTDLYKKRRAAKKIAQEAEQNIVLLKEELKRRKEQINN